MMENTLKFVIPMLLWSVIASAQTAKPPSDSELAAITARGRMLEEYDAPSWHATDEVMKLHPAKVTVSKYVAKKIGDNWTIVFGRYSENKDAFLIVYEATQGSSPREFTVKTFDPPKPDTEFFLAAAKAIDLALQNVQLEKRPYNTYVLPQDSGQLYVYILPAQTAAEVYPLGGDTRFLISADGSKILETRPLHKTILEVKRSVPAGAKPAGGMHTHVLTDTPEDTDVFHVLRQTHPLPEFVGTKSGVYEIETDGKIKRVK